jgi:NSS family neurotransmitter:Na+ symporter
MLSLLEVPVAFLGERFGLARGPATAAALALIAAPAATAALSNSLLADMTLFGKNFFDLYDFLSSNVLLPLGGLAISLFVGWFWRPGDMRSVIGGEGRPANPLVARAFIVVIRYVTPALVALVLLRGLGLI